MAESSKTIVPGPSAPPAPPAPPIPKTEQGLPADIKPRSLLDAIEGGAILKKTKTVVKNTVLKGKVTDDTSSETPLVEISENKTPSLMESLTKNFNKIRPMITGEDLDDIDTKDDWEESNQTTPTNKIDKTINSPRSDKAELGITIDKGKGKAKFLDAISNDDDEDKYQQTSSKIATVLKSIQEKFPNLSQKTL